MMMMEMVMRPGLMDSFLCAKLSLTSKADLPEQATPFCRPVAWSEAKEVDKAQKSNSSFEEETAITKVLKCGPLSDVRFSLRLLKGWGPSLGGTVYMECLGC